MVRTAAEAAVAAMQRAVTGEAMEPKPSERDQIDNPGSGTGGANGAPLTGGVRVDPPQICRIFFNTFVAVP